MSSESQVKVGEYLFHRLKQLGVQTVFGVPGDYELALLDLIGDSGLTFSGNPNELIASYAADGYGRLKGVGAWVDTLGPGELSSYCGHAGAYAEFVPVVHIVGYPSRQAMKNHAIMHHTLGTGRFDMYHQMVKNISCDTAILTDPATAPNQIDRCLQNMLIERRPCYIGIPVDMSHLLCDKLTLDTALFRDPPINNVALENKVISELRSILDTSKSPVLIVDGNARQQLVTIETTALVKRLAMPTFTTVMGKGIIDEHSEYFGGLYAGSGSSESARKIVEQSDAVFWIGSYPSDFNTGEFSERIDAAARIDFQRDFVQIRDKKYSVTMKYVLKGLVKNLEQTNFTRPMRPVDWQLFPNINTQVESYLSQDSLWERLEKWLSPGDFIISETGTSSYGTATMKLPSQSSMFTQTVFGSIGFATGAAVGAFKAIRELNNFKRCILITGEGSFHLTIQAIMDMHKLELHPIIFILNNDGYTIERLIHGPDAHYNTVPAVDYSKLAHVFGPTYESRYWGPIGTANDLERALEELSSSNNSMLRLVELKLAKMDAPSWLKAIAEGVEAYNKTT